MKKRVLILLFFIHYSLFTNYSNAQCSLCKKSAQQLGEKPAKGLNAGIIYLAATPFLIAGFLYYRWRKINSSS